MLQHEEAGRPETWSRMAGLMGVVHDMRTPLATISASTELLEQFVGDAEGTLLIDAVHRQVRSLNRMLKELTDLAGLAGNEYQVQRETLDLAGLMREVVAEFRLLQTGHEFVPELPAAGLWAGVDGAQVRRILENLLSNAAAYSPHGSSVYVRLRYGPGSGSEVVIEVEDEGPGVPEPARLEIFKPFVRMSSSPGNGLGLYVVSRLAAAHGGRTWLEDGKAGALFKVALPAQPA